MPCPAHPTPSLAVPPGLQMIQVYSRLSTTNLLTSAPPSSVIGVLWKLAGPRAHLSNVLESFFWLLSLFYLNSKLTMLAPGSFHPGALRRLKFCSTCLCCSQGPTSPVKRSTGHTTCYTLATSSFQVREPLAGMGFLVIRPYVGNAPGSLPRPCRGGASQNPSKVGRVGGSVQGLLAWELGAGEAVLSLLLPDPGHVVTNSGLSFPISKKYVGPFSRSPSIPHILCGPRL